MAVEGTSPGWRRWLPQSRTVRASIFLLLLFILLTIIAVAGMGRDKLSQRQSLTGGRGASTDGFMQLFFFGRGILFAAVFGLAARYFELKVLDGLLPATPLWKPAALPPASAADAPATPQPVRQRLHQLAVQLLQHFSKPRTVASAALWIITALSMLAPLTAFNALALWRYTQPNWQIGDALGIVVAAYICFGVLIQLLFVALLGHIVHGLWWMGLQVYSYAQKAREGRSVLTSAGGMHSADVEAATLIIAPPPTAAVESGKSLDNSEQLAGWLRLLTTGYTRLMRVVRSWLAPLPPPLALIALITAVALAAEGARYAMQPPQLLEVPIRLARLPPGLDGYRIAVLTDLHLGPCIGRSDMQYVVDQVLALDPPPDAVFIVGDIIEGALEVYQPAVEPLRQLAAACNGTAVAGADRWPASSQHRCMAVFAVSGNHDTDSSPLEEKQDYLRGMGITVLINDRVSMPFEESDPLTAQYGSFDIAGVPDWAMSRYTDVPHNMTEAVVGRNSSRELVVLAHQPGHAGDAGSVGAGLMVAGHTHAGQIPPTSLLTYLFNPYYYGLYMHTKGPTDSSNPQRMVVYVSGGTAQWGPISRIAAPHEITLFTLHRGYQ